MSVKSIRLLPIFLVFGLVTILGACSTTGDVTSPDNNAAQEGAVDPETPAQTTEAE